MWRFLRRTWVQSQPLCLCSLAHSRTPRQSQRGRLAYRALNARNVGGSKSAILSTVTLTPIHSSQSLETRIPSEATTARLAARPCLPRCSIRRVPLSHLILKIPAHAGLPSLRATFSTRPATANMSDKLTRYVKCTADRVLTPFTNVSQYCHCQLGQGNPTTPPHKFCTSAANMSVRHDSANPRQVPPFTLPSPF